MHKNLLIVTSSPTKGGNGDALAAAALDVAHACGANVSVVNLRDLQIRPCNACGACAKLGRCAHRDGMDELMPRLHDAEAIVFVAPVYYNTIEARGITAINRLYPTFACESYEFGPRKRVGVMLTCASSTEEWLNAHVDSILTLGSISRCIEEYRTQVFDGCHGKDSCRNSPEALKRAESLVKWTLEG